MTKYVKPTNPTIADIPVPQSAINMAAMISSLIDWMIPLAIIVVVFIFVTANEHVNTEAERQAYVVAYEQLGDSWLNLTELERIAYAKDNDIWPAFDEGDLMFGKLSKPLVLRRDFKHNGGMIIRIKMWWNDKIN